MLELSILQRKFRAPYRGATGVVDSRAKDRVDEKLVVLLHLDHSRSYGVALLHGFFQLACFRIRKRRAMTDHAETG